MVVTTKYLSWKNVLFIYNTRISLKDEVMARIWNTDWIPPYHTAVLGQSEKVLALSRLLQIKRAIHLPITLAV